MNVIFGLLFTLLGFSAISVVAEHNIEPADNSCRARAWVRAPDLELGQVVQGDVKVKLDGACEEVLRYTLKLRFAERAWVKTRRAGVKIPERPTPNHSFDALALPIDDPDLVHTLSSDRELETSTWDKYKDALRDPSLWLVREDERIAFEAKYDLCKGKHISNDVVEPFAILVPSTLYPPAFNPWSSSFSATELDNSASEHIYAYIVDVAFKNGTIHEVSAGYTSFNAPTVSESASPSETINVTVSQLSSYLTAKGQMSEAADSGDVDSFILEVTFPQGRRLKQGSVNNITIVSHQIGPRIQRPVRLGVDPYVTQKQHWAASFAADNETAQRLLNSDNMYMSQLVTKNPLAENSHASYCYHGELAEPRFSEDGTVTNGTMFSTKSITAQFRVPEDCPTFFEMHHQTSEVELVVEMVVRNISSGNGAVTEDSEYDWIPAMCELNNWSIAYLSGRIPIFIHSKQDDQTKVTTTDNVHYLSPEARAPVFVDPSSVQDLIQKSVQDRDTLCTKAQPSFNRREDGDVVEDRYFAWGQQTEMHYVGDTWFRKVVLPMKIEAEAQVSGLRVQS